MTGTAKGAAAATMAEGPEEARGRPPGQDDGAGDHAPVPSLRGPPAAAGPCPRDAAQLEPQAPALAPAAAAAPEESEPQRELRRRREAAASAGAGLREPAGGEAAEAEALREKPARLSAREYSRQVHEWLWQSYCGYLTWHSGLAALPAYCSPPPPAAGYAAAAAPPPPQLAYYGPFCFPSAGAAGAEPGAAAGVGTPGPVAGLGPRAPPGQGSGRAAAATRAGSAAPPRSASESGRQAGEQPREAPGAPRGGLRVRGPRGDGRGSRECARASHCRAVHLERPGRFPRAEESALESEVES